MLRSEIWIISTLISIGVIGMLVFNWPDVPDRQLENDSVANRMVADDPNDALLDNSAGFEPLANDQLVEMQQRVATGDNYLDVGSHREALKCYQSVLSYYRDDPAFILRVALATELSGNGDGAEKKYLDVLRKIPNNEVLRLFAMLGIARCKIALGQIDNANELLCENLLSSISWGEKPRFLESEVCLQLVKIRQRAVEKIVAEKTSVLSRPIFEEFPTEGSALIATLKSVAPLDAESSNKNLSDDTFNPEPANSVDEVDPVRIEDTFEGIDRTQLSLIQKPNDDVKLIVVAGSTKTVFVADFLNQIASLTDLDIPIEKNVAPFLSGRTTKFENSSLSVALLLDCVLAPVNLAWRQNGNNIELLPINSLNRIELRDYLANQAIRAGRYFVLNYPDSWRKNHVRVTMANLNFSIGNLDNSIAQLKQLQEDSSHVELAAKIEFDLGLLEANFNRMESAIEMFMAAIDQSANSYVRSIAYANVGRIQLQRGAIEPAKIASSRSLMLFNNTEVQQQAALDLARSYLLSNNPLSANQTLYQHAAVISGSKIEAIALVYGAYARTLGTLSPIDKKKALETLIVALAGIKTDELNLSVDRILVAQAFVRAGLVDRAIDVLQDEDQQSSIPPTSIPSGWNRDRIYELAQLLEYNGQTEEALKHYSNLAAIDEGGIGQNSTLKIAMLELYRNQAPDQCLERCNKLWELDLTDQVKSQILRLMGEAYTKLGNHELATYCFLGMLPNEVGNGKTNTERVRLRPNGNDTFADSDNG